MLAWDGQKQGGGESQGVIPCEPVVKVQKGSINSIKLRAKSGLYSGELYRISGGPKPSKT